MTPFTVGLIAIVILCILLISRMPIGFAMAVVGIAGFAYLGGINAAHGVLRTTPYATFADYGLSVIPLFILMGQFCFFAGLSKDLYDTAYSWLGQLPGGLGMATVGACTGFAAVSGSSLATAATMGAVALPEMRRYKYDPALATGCVAAGGSIGILIPPSIVFILYGIITEQSIGKLFLAGLIPGLLESVSYIITIYILCKINPRLGPRSPKMSFIQKIASLKNTWVVLLLFVLVMGGLYMGVFSPTEAAGVGAFGAFIFGIARRRFSWQTFNSSLIEAGKTTAMLFIIILGATILNHFLALSRLPFELAHITAGIVANRYIILGGILLIYFVLGCVMDSVAIMILITPIFFPVVISLGFNPIWFGVLMVRACEIGMITPPVGLNVFVLRGVAKDVPMYTIFRGVIPFLIADIFNVALLIAIPQLSLLLPSLMK